jgi:hypothetical protein
VQCLNLKCRAFGPEGDNAAEAVEKWNSRHRVPISKRQLLCGWLGMAGSTGCVLPLGHSGGHRFSDGSGSGHNVKVMAHPLAGANVDRGVRVEIRWKHRKQRG